MSLVHVVSRCRTYTWMNVEIICMKNVVQTKPFACTTIWDTQYHCATSTTHPNEREKRRYERISTIDYESQITITITFINITIVKLHFFPPPISVSLLLQLTLHCPNWHPLAFLALLAHHFDSTIFLSLLPNVESVERDDDKETSRFNTHFHFFIWKIICFP